MTEPIRPLAAKFDRDREAWVWGLNEKDFDRMQRGYGCVRCLEPFAAWVPICYVCGQVNEVAVAEVPEEWIR